MRELLKLVVRKVKDPELSQMPDVRGDCGDGVV